MAAFPALGFSFDLKWLQFLHNIFIKNVSALKQKAS